MEQSLMEQKIDAYKFGIGHMKELMPEVVEAYHDFTATCFKSGALDEKQKQLIAIGISIFANNEVCTYYHVQEALASGASRDEIAEAAAVAAAVGSGHALSQGATRVQSAMESFKGASH